MPGRSNSIIIASVAQLVEQVFCKDQVAGSSPVNGSRGISSVGRAPALQAGCQEFESPILHKRIGDIRAHISERKKNRKTNPCEREVGSFLVPCY